MHPTAGFKGSQTALIGQQSPEAAGIRQGLMVPSEDLSLQSWELGTSPSSRQANQGKALNAIRVWTLSPSPSPIPLQRLLV